MKYIATTIAMMISVNAYSNESNYFDKFINLVNTSQNIVVEDISDKTKETYKKEMTFDGKTIFFTTEVDFGRNMNNVMLGYMSSHYKYEYQFELCDFSSYKFNSKHKNSYIDQNGVPLGFVRFSTNDGYMEKIDLDKNSGDWSRPRTRTGASMEMQIPDSNGQPKKIVSLLMKAMNEKNCKKTIFSEMHSEEI